MRANHAGRSGRARRQREMSTRGHSLRTSAQWLWRVARARWMRVALPASLAIVGVVAAVPGSLAWAAPQHAAGPLHLVSSAPPTQAQPRWADPRNGTAFTVVLVPSGQIIQPPAGIAGFRQARGTFVFTLNTGDMLYGVVPIVTSESDGLGIQDTLAQGASPGNYCVFGALIPAKPFPGGTDAKGQPLPAVSAHPARILLRARFNPNGLVAYAHVSYVDAQVGADEHYIPQLCGKGVDSPHAADMLSGCSDMSTPCAQPLATTTTSVKAYDDAMLAAQTSGDWSTVYHYCSETITGQYSSDDFSTTIKNEVAKVGKITAIAPVTTAPNIQTGTVGQPFFAVTQHVTLSKDGQNTSQQVTSYFLLEQGEWRFWFSA